ncbi:MAG: hypothetical protein LUD02_11445 [Tannerellaceae bacterium]|nr:hypothetical protein [Tannerellaceae bacterium]MCD8264672.1 hypothetical protein [Tannerellaceae bacterium]
MKVLRINITPPLLLLLVAFILQSCNDTIYNQTEIENGEGETWVNLSITLPGNVPPATRALNTTDENHVESIEILVFNTGGNYLYTAIGEI